MARRNWNIVHRRPFAICYPNIVSIFVPRFMGIYRGFTKSLLAIKLTSWLC